MFDLIYSLVFASNLHLSFRHSKTKARMTHQKTKLSHQIVINVMQTNKPFSANELQIAGIVLITGIVNFKMILCFELNWICCCRLSLSAHPKHLDYLNESVCIRLLVVHQSHCVSVQSLIPHVASCTALQLIYSWIKWVAILNHLQTYNNNRRKHVCRRHSFDSIISAHQPLL